MLLNSAERTTERMTAFMPGASPPDVSIAILEIFFRHKANIQNLSVLFTLYLFGIKKEAQTNV